MTVRIENFSSSMSISIAVSGLFSVRLRGWGGGVGTPFYPRQAGAIAGGAI